MVVLIVVVVDLVGFIVPAIPQSEVLAKFLQEIGEKCGEILAKMFADFRPSISRENGRKSFHEKSSTFSTVHQIKFFSLLQLWGFGAQGFIVDEVIWIWFVCCETNPVLTNNNNNNHNNNRKQTEKMERNII